MTADSTRSRLPLVAFFALHLLFSLAAETAFAREFGHSPRALVAHMLIVAEWDLALVGVFRALVAVSSYPGARWLRWTYGLLPAATGTLQVYLYALNAVSNASWGRNMTAHLVSAFAPTVWSGKEPFPVGAAGILVFACGTLAIMIAAFGRWSRMIEVSIRAWCPDSCALPRPEASRYMRALAAAAVMIAVFAATITEGVASRDSLFWKQEPVASFFRPEGFAFEPTARREAVADRDAAIRAAYPRRVSDVHRKHVVLIIIDSLRADRMQVYGYRRQTTPFLSHLVASGRMKKVDAAFSSCSESFCGITSTLASREFRDISPRTYQLQDVLHDEGYQTWFVLSGNHRAWNGLPQFYHVSDDHLFDGSQTRRYTMDDDRVVLEGLERVPPASADRPTFFYLHLMSTHYLGVQFPESHVFTRPDDEVSPGLEPYKILAQLNKPDRYDDKVLQADGMLCRIFDALSAKGYLDDAIVVITGDHGEGLGERHWAHGWNLYNEDIRIPLLLYDAPAAAYPDLTFAAQVDVAPTILDRLGLPIPPSWEGQSLVAPTERRFTHHQTYFVPNRFAVLYRDGPALFKFIATPQYGKEELYDETTDRSEQRNLVSEQPTLAALLREQVQAYLQDQP